MAENTLNDNAEHKIDCENEIPDLCKSLFLTKDKFLSIIWVVAGLLLAAGGGCIAWAMATNNSITELKITQTTQDNRIEFLNDEINQKLDILIKQKGEK
jgi:apolipoprotein N-acyltransferase